MDWDDLLHGTDRSEPPARIRFERNAPLLTWLEDWLGVNRRHESRKAIRAFPAFSVPSRYRVLPRDARNLYRGIKVAQPVMDRLMDKGSVTLRRNGVVSYSLDFGRAKDFAIGADPAVVMEKPITRAAVLLYVPACLDDLAWHNSKTPEEWHEARRELNFFAREREVLIRDDDPYWRQIRLDESVHVDDGRTLHPVNWKRKLEREQARTDEALLLTEGQNYEAMLPPYLASHETMGPRAKALVKKARQTLKRNDRVVWAVRWIRLSLLLILCYDLRMKTWRNSAEDVEALKAYQPLAEEMARRSNIKVDDVDSLASHWADWNNHLGNFEHYLSLPIQAAQNLVFVWQTPVFIEHFLQSEERKWQQERKALIHRTQDGDRPIIEFGNGLAWWALSRAACSDEGDAMGHCGNSPRSNSTDRIFSLRQQIKTGGTVAYKPYLTFILYDDGKLGEMKARFNKSPKNAAAAGFIPSDFQREIVAFLKMPFVKGLKGGSYLPQEDFKLADLDQANFEDLLEAKPSLFDLQNKDMKQRALPVIAKRLRSIYGEDVEAVGDQIVVAKTANLEEFINRFIPNPAESNAMKVLTYLRERRDYGEDVPEDWVDDEADTRDYENFLQFVDKKDYSLYRDIEEYLIKRTKRDRRGGYDGAFSGNREMAKALANDTDLSMVVDECIKGMRHAYLTRNVENNFDGWLNGPAPIGKVSEGLSVVPQYRNDFSDLTNPDASSEDVPWWTRPILTRIRLYDAARVVEAGTAPPIRFRDYTFDQQFDEDSLHDHTGDIESVLRWADLNDDDEDEPEEDDDR